MQTLPDYHLDALFRAALVEEAEALASTAASESQMLERVGRVLARRRTRRQLATLLLAAVLTTLTAAAIALGGSRLTPPVTLDRSPEASASPEPSVAVPGPRLGTELDDGPVVLRNPRAGGPPITVTIPAPGWSMDPGNRVLLKNQNQGQPDGAYLHGWWTTGELYIPADPCEWQSTMPETPASTVDEIVLALASQATRDASGPVEILPDGHAGQSITLHVPDDLAWADGEFTDCDLGMFCTLSRNIAGVCTHTLYRPGQVQEIWIVDVNGQVLFMEGAYYPETPGGDVDELRAILGSMTFGEVVHGWPDTTENQAGLYAWGGRSCGLSCNIGFCTTDMAQATLISPSMSSRGGRSMMTARSLSPSLGTTVATHGSMLDTRSGSSTSRARRSPSALRQNRARATPTWLRPTPSSTRCTRNSPRVAHTASGWSSGSRPTTGTPDSRTTTGEPG